MVSCVWCLNSGPAASTSSDLQVFVPVYDKISQNKIRPKPRRADLLRLRPAASHLRHNSCGRLHCRTRCRTLRPTRAWFKYFLMYSDSVAGFCQQSPVTSHHRSAGTNTASLCAAFLHPATGILPEMDGYSNSYIHVQKLELNFIKQAWIHKRYRQK